jgi:hypothetical protein
VDFVFGTYNFENGGIDGTGLTRFHRQLRRLKDHQAHAWAFQECSDWDKNGCLESAEDALGMRGFVARSTKNPGGNVAVLVKVGDRIKIIRTRHEGMFRDEKVPYWHAVAVVYVDVMGYGIFRLASGHLAPSSPEKRAEDAEYLGLIAEKPEPLILGIDGNAYALNEPERDVTGVHPAKVRRKSDTRAAVYLAEYMTDCGAQMGCMVPTVGHTREDKLAYRCDRNYTTLPEEAIIGHRVVTDEDEDSDHRKVLTTVRLDTGHP